MSIECYNTICNFHNKTEPFCEEAECHCMNGDPDEICCFFATVNVPISKKELACYTCATMYKCEMAWINQNIDKCIFELMWELK